MIAVTTRKTWQETPLGQVTEIVRDSIIAERIADGTRYVGLEHMDNEGGINNPPLVSNGDLASNKFQFGPRHILYGKLRPYLRKTARPDFHGVCSTDILPILAGPRVDRGYLYHYLRHPRVVDLATSRCEGVNLPRLSPKQFELLTIPLPFPNDPEKSLAEQKRIAAILDKADALRRKHREMMRCAEQLPASVYMQTFGDPLHNQKGWQIRKLDEICRKITDGVHLRPTYTETGIPFISVQNVTTGKLLFEGCKYVSEADYAKMSRSCKPEFGDILYTKVGATYGRPAIVDTHRDFGLYVSVALIKPNRDIVNPVFLEEVLGSPAIKRQADRSVKGAGVPDLHLIEIRNFLIPVPPMGVQKTFVAHSARFHQLAAKTSESGTFLDHLFNSLVQRAFRGEI